MERQIVLRGRMALGYALTGYALTLSSILATGTSCRSTRSEVPPHRPFVTDGRKAPPINFSGDSANPADGLPPVSTGQPSSFGTPAPGAKDNYGAPTTNAYGPPSTSTLGTLPGGDATKPGLGGFQPSGTTPGRPDQPVQTPSPNPFGPQ